MKQLGEQIAWEFYFYDYKRRQREVSITRVLRAIHRYMPTVVVPNENLPYFMFSLDMNNTLVTGQASLDVVHMYVGNPGSTVSSGIAYAVRADSTTLENFYFFFDAGSQLADVATRSPAPRCSTIRSCRLKRCLSRNCAGAARFAWRTSKLTIASIFPASLSINCNGFWTGFDIPRRSPSLSEPIVAILTTCFSMWGSTIEWSRARCGS